MLSPKIWLQVKVVFITGDSVCVSLGCHGSQNIILSPSLSLIKYSMAVKLRPRRGSPKSGCKLGTCQTSNLAHTLYHIGQRNGKDQSKKAQDPTGFGR